MVKSFKLNKGELIYIMDKNQSKSFVERINSKLENISKNLMVSLFIIPIITSLIASGLGSACVWLVTVSKNINEINKKYGNLEDRVISIENLNNSNNGNDNNNTITGDSDPVINGNNNTVIYYQFSQDAMLYPMENGEEDSYIDPQVNAANIDVQKEIYSFPILNTQKEKSMAVNVSTKKSVTMSEMSCKKIFCTYQINNQEILFYGQFTEEGQWDGDCLINIYENNSLVNITEAKYDKGTLQKYEQVLSYINNMGNSVWSISNREMIDDKTSSGESCTYYKIEECSKKFHTASIDDLIYVRDFEKEYCSAKEGYYYGQTSKGFYNDITGESYNIKYFENGKIRTLYVGNFVDGIYKDNSGKAWYITREKDTNYMYFIGKFDYNTAVEKATTRNSKTNLTRSEIDEILIKSGKTYKYLDWQFEE